MSQLSCDGTIGVPRCNQGIQAAKVVLKALTTFAPAGAALAISSASEVPGAWLASLVT